MTALVVPIPLGTPVFALALAANALIKQAQRRSRRGSETVLALFALGLAAVSVVRLLIRLHA